MPFSEEFLETAAREIESRYVVPDFERVRELIMNALKMCAAVEPSINLRNVDIYIHGSYANKSNIYFPSNLEIMVEITTAKRFSPDEVSLEDNYFVDIPLEFGPREFRLLFANALRDIVGDKLSEQAKTLRLSGLEKIKHDVDITPCMNFHFYKDNGSTGDRTRGILMYDSSIDRQIVSFPRQHNQNGFDKDQATGGNFKRMVRLFKTLHSLNVNEFYCIGPKVASGYFIECLLYNVPDQLFFDASAPFRGDENGVAPQLLSAIFLKILNYLINADLEAFICQNTVWRLMGTMAEFWTKERADEFLAAIIRLHAAFPPSRTFLA